MWSRYLDSLIYHTIFLSENKYTILYIPGQGQGHIQTLYTIVFFLAKNNYIDCLIDTVAPMQVIEIRHAREKSALECPVDDPKQFVNKG